MRGRCHQEGSFPPDPSDVSHCRAECERERIGKGLLQLHCNRLCLWLPFGLRADPPHREGFQCQPFCGQVRRGSRLRCLSCSVLGVVGGGGRLAHSHCPAPAGEGDQGSPPPPAWGLWGSGFQTVCRGTSLGSSLTLGVGTGYSFTRSLNHPLQLPILSKQFAPWPAPGSQFIQALRFVSLRVLKCIKKSAKSFVITFPFLKYLSDCIRKSLLASCPGGPPGVASCPGAGSRASVPLKPFLWPHNLPGL